jgi:hypothetical protein
MVGGSKRLGNRGRTLKMLLGELGVRLKDVSGGRADVGDGGAEGSWL